jgi:Ca2+-binding EF-hand superfamily protein
VGFQPTKFLTPIDAFEMFDEDQSGQTHCALGERHFTVFQSSGFLDEDEFRYAVEYLKLPINDEQLENLFYLHDLNYTGMIDYVEFREIFLEVGCIRVFKG